MRVLVIGSGGREHAIIRAFSKSERVTKLYCADGNAGISLIADCVPIKPDDISGLVAFASGNEIDLTFVGGETSLALGIVNEFQTQGLKIIGPDRRAAELEASKSFAKDFMVRHGVPTAKYLTANSAEEAIRFLETGEFGDADKPVVIKADGLAAGKGVVVAANRSEAINAIKGMEILVGAAAAEKIVLEECLVGKEVSLLMFADGEDFALMPPTRDHKRIGEGDTGPNTGGMGTFTDDLLLSSQELKEITETMIRPTLRGCIDEGFRYRGILFLGIMMTAGGPKLLEYNVRFGDPETQAILVRLETDLADICEAMLDGTLGDINITWRPGSSACIVLASRGYPANPRKGDIIRGLSDANSVAGVEIFHAGTAFSTDTLSVNGATCQDVVTSGGRVLGITSTGSDLTTALRSAYSAVDRIKFDGMQFRRDIGA